MAEVAAVLVDISSSVGPSSCRRKRVDAAGAGGAAVAFVAEAEAVDVFSLVPTSDAIGSFFARFGDFVFVFEARRSLTSSSSSLSARI